MGRKNDAMMRFDEEKEQGEQKKDDKCRGIQKAGSPREEALPRRLDVKHANIKQEIETHVSKRSSNKKEGAERKV